MTDTSADIRIVTLAERPELYDAAQAITDASWPPFMHHDEVAGRLWHRLMADFSEFQFVLITPDDTLIAYANCIPVVWNGDRSNLPEEGWDWAFENGVAAFDQEVAPNTLSAIGIQVNPAQRNRGLSTTMLQGMRAIAAQHGLQALIAPVRPTLKHLYPLTSIDRYVTWTNAKGEPFDPWLRAHWRLGAQLIGACHQSMNIGGTVAEWTDWTGMAFPESGRYIVPTALEPVEINFEADSGRYLEPNVWMIHTVDEPA